MSFRWPLKKFTISQGFGGNAAYYKQYGQKGHNGIDMAANAGTPVYAADEGTVAFEGWGKSGAAGYAGWMGDPAGICILINHVGSYGGYAHLTSTVINKGQKVKKGQLIGYVGATGAATGPHLHFEMLPLSPNFQNGYAGRINPNPYIETTKTATEAEIKKAYLEILERPADKEGIQTYLKFPIDFVRSELQKSPEKRRLDKKKADAAKAAAEKAKTEAAKKAEDAKKAAEAKKAAQAAAKAEEERVKAEAELARIAEEERIEREEAEAHAQAQAELADKAKEEMMTTATEQEAKVQEIAEAVSESDVVVDLISGVSKKVKLTIYIIGDALIGLGLIAPSVAIVAGWDDMVRVVALSSSLAAAGGFVLTMFGVYKSNKK